jgi:hypothetical protein
MAVSIVPLSVSSFEQSDQRLGRQQRRVGGDKFGESGFVGHAFQAIDHHP